MPDQDLLTIKQVAQLLQLRETTIYAWVKNGKIPAIKVGRSWQFRQSELTLWLDSRVIAQEKPLV